MDSDSSHDGEDHQNGAKRRDWENRQNSDVSDDENFSRGAKSIDSPPESPPRGGGNLDSPPASPAQGVESPHSVYSGSRRSSGSSDGTGEYPQSPDSPPPKTPESVENDNSCNRERRAHIQVNEEHGRVSSPSPNRSRSNTPDRSHFKHRRESESQSLRERLSYASPESNDSQNRHRRDRQDMKESPVHRTIIRNSERRTDSNRRSRSPLYKSQGSSDRERSDRSQSSTPKQDHSPVAERHSRHKSPDNYFSIRHREWEESPNRKFDTRARRGSSSSSDSSVSTLREVSRNNRALSNPTSPDRSRSDNRNIDCDDHSRSSRRSSDDRKRSNTEGLGLDESSNQDRKGFRSHRTSTAVNDRLKTSYGPQSPGRHSDSDGRSNISSNSSIGSPASQNSTPEPKHGTKPDKIEIKSHGEDLSDVSDVESIGSASDVEQKPKEAKKTDKEKEEKDRKNGLNIEEAEQLDFEVEENDSPSKKSKDNKEIDSEEGEVKELEEGELSDEGELRPEETEPRPVCRFFSRGQCTWGSSCRFVHPGVTDKGNYTMFDMVRPLVPMNTGPPPPHIYQPMDCYRPPIERPPMMGPPPYQQPMMRREEPAASESAWERGLRQAKEMIRRSSKRKETDADFEEKKMTLSLSGQEEYDKDNTDYYPRPASPVYDDYHERTKEGEKRYRSVSDRFGDYPPPSSYYRESWYDERSHYHRSSRHHSSSGAGYGNRSGGPDDYYNSRKKKYSSHEVVVQRIEKGWIKEGGSPPATRGRGGRGDEWADPWMRSKSPSRKIGSRKKSYSSRSRSSSYSSSSSSRTSSYSSYSRSRSSASRSGTSRSRSRSSFARKKLSPLSKRAKSPFSRDRRVGGEVDRGLHMNPPPPSPRAGGLSPRRNPTPPPQADRANRNISARLLAAAMRDRSVSSTHSSSGTESSGSSSDSSSESGSSSSSSSPVRHKSSVQHTRKKIDLEEKLAQAVKAKAMDALKLSGQKQQIKLTLKGTGSSISERLSAPVTRKRPAPDSPHSGDGDSSPTVSKKKSMPSRREELLKQLKAVEDAIARKRSKT